jgi:hypothetical protein
MKEVFSLGLGLASGISGKSNLSFSIPTLEPKRTDIPPN